MLHHEPHRRAAALAVRRPAAGMRAARAPRRRTGWPALGAALSLALLRLLGAAPLAAQSNDLLFRPDAGVRVDSAGLAGVRYDTGGLVHLYFTRGPLQGLAISSDGLDFTEVDPHDYPDYRFHTLPDGTFRRYFVELAGSEAQLRSRSSTDGIDFTLDPGVRFTFPANDAITSPSVYMTVFNNSAGAVDIVYLAGAIDNARSIASLPGDNGWSFTVYRTNVFGDSTYGGGNYSYWDPNAIVLPDGRPRVLVMNQHGPPVPPAVPKGTIYSFTSADGGDTFERDAGVRLRYDDWTEFDVYSLNDPKALRLADGRYRMYVAAMIRVSDQVFRWAVLSATTPAAGTSGEPAPPGRGRAQLRSVPNPFRSRTTIELELPGPAVITLVIHDLRGRRVRTLLRGAPRARGRQGVTWDGTGDRGRRLAAGVYFCTLAAGGRALARAQVLLLR